MSWVRAAALDAVDVDAMVAVEVAGRAVLLVHLEDGLRAYDDRCPHRGYALGRGTLAESIVRCPVHGWTFDARDGSGVNPASACLVSHPVRVELGIVYVELQEASSESEDDPTPGDP